MAKRRPYTAVERAEVHHLRMKGRLGRLNFADQERSEQLHKINPGEYGEISKGAVEEADATVNPLLKKDDE